MCKSRFLMTLKIIGAGFGRTGTNSTRAALDQLGLPCYHMEEVMDSKKNPHHLGFWCRVAKSEPGTQHDWSEVFENYEACVDFPAACVWQELLEAYPEAKVLLTLHPGGPDSWYDSTWETIYAPSRMWQGKVLEIATPFGRKFMGMVGELAWERSLKGTMGDRERAKQRYQELIDEVTAAVPPEKLLIFKVSEGWGPLCEFVGAPEPEGEFPRTNDRASMKKMLHGIMAGAYVIVGVAALLLAGLVFGIVSLFS